MIDFNFYLESAEQFRTLGVKNFRFLGDFLKEVYDAGFHKIATFETVDIGKLHDSHYRWDCELREAVVQPDELIGSYERRVIFLTDAIRIFLTAFLSEKITKETTSFAKDISRISTEEIASRS
jgi:hypothetical protein